MDADVIVVGAGNAAFAAAVSAREQGARVIMLECAPQDEAGGNTRFTAGAMRVAYDSTDDLRHLMPDLTDAEIAQTDFGTYSATDFYDDLCRVTDYRTDAQMSERLANESKATLLWMRDQGIRFMPIWGRQAFKIDGRFKFWGGLTVEAWGGGPGLIDAWTQIAQHREIDLRYDTRALRLITDETARQTTVTGIEVKNTLGVQRLNAPSIVLASGGFQASPQWRARYLGPKWDLAKVRGTRFNTGGGIAMALDIGAVPYGNWSGCHAVGWDRHAPEFGDLNVGDGFQKHSYPFGVMINANGERFVDEGADFRNYTYAKYGSVILEQPQQFAWQIFDATVNPLLRDEYRIREVSKVAANTLEELVSQLDGVDAHQTLATLAQYNQAVARDVAFDPNVKDGKCTRGLPINKSNWANPIETPPFEAYAVTCGITFTFGGLRINSDAQVLDTDLQPIRGLYAAGELLGGLFVGNYPGGSGLTAGSVFGRLAGHCAGHIAMTQQAI